MGQIDVLQIINNLPYEKWITTKEIHEQLKNKCGMESIKQSVKRLRKNKEIIVEYRNKMNGYKYKRK